MTDATKEEVSAAPAPAGKSKNGLLAIFLGLNSVLLAGVLGVLLLKPPAAAAPAPGGHEAAKPAGEHGEGGGEHAEGGVAPTGTGPTLRLPDFVVKLRNPETDRYVRLSFEIEVGNEKDKELVTPHLPQIREGFIAYLSDRTAEDLRGSEGIERTKEALMTKLNAMTHGKGARAIYITDLVIQ